MTGGRRVVRGTACGAVRTGASDLRAGEAGVATVLACVIAMALIVVTGLVAEFGAALLARHRAEAAADLGALAGAGMVLSGQPTVCDRAAAVARSNGAAVQDCTLIGTDLLLTVTVAVRLGPLAATATARARAGPVGPNG
jgi:secretion/DNA translocation related TadE-like protein